MTEKEKFIDEVIEITCSKPQDVSIKWIIIFSKYLEFKGFNDTSIRELWKTQFQYDKDVTIDDFYEELHYCADRMCLERLFRLHGMYWKLKMGGM